MKSARVMNSVFRMSQQSYVIVGTGAVGGFYGARLQQAGCEVHFLLHSDYEHVAQHGLTIESKDGDFTLPTVNAYRVPTEVPPCDTVIVALKATRNETARQLLPPLTRHNPTVVVMQNGLDNERELAPAAGAGPLLAALCFICSNKAGPGHIQHLDYGYVRLAEYRPTRVSAGITDAMRVVNEDLTLAGLPVVMDEDLELARWKKLVWNVPYNGLSVVLDATTDQLMSDPPTRDLVEHLMEEVATGAEACGRTIDRSFIEKMLKDTAKMRPYRTSMKLDFDRGCAMEVEAIFGNPVRAARAVGVNLPRIDTIYQQLRFLDALRHRPLSR